MNKVDSWFKDAGKEANGGMRTHPSSDPMWFMVGCADYPDREKLMLIIQAAQHLCAVNRKECDRLLRKALGGCNG